MLKKLMLGGVATCGAVLAPLSVFAQESGKITIDSNLSGIDVAGALSDMGGTLATGIIAALALAIGCWGVMLLWKKIKGAVN
ncbi:MAG: hypothetical protein Q4C70_05275 [Planctomycetia bacterium]|nr:hypothetical protein [Planctomycetia bacterium]